MQPKALQQNRRPDFENAPRRNYKEIYTSGNKKCRLVVDFRKLNQVMVKDNCPIPNTTEIL